MSKKVYLQVQKKIIMTEKIQKVLSDSKAARWTALFLVSFTMLAAYFFVDMIAPLQELVQKSYNWDAQTYGFFSGSEYMLNVFGFLIISGIILDKMGIRFTGITATIVMLIGGCIKMYGLSDTFNSGGFGYEFFGSFWTSLSPTAKMASLGYAVFGIGVEMAGITASRAIVKWFKGKELALAMGMQLATARMGASIAFWFSSSIAFSTNPPNAINSIYVGVALLAIGLLTFLIYTVFDTRLDKQIGAAANADEPSEEFKIKDLKKILTNPGFLAIAGLCVLFYSGVFPFLKYATNMMQAKLGVSAATGGFISGMLPVGTIVLTPILGSYLDRKGNGATMMIFGAALLMLAHLTYAFIPLNMPLAIIAIVVLGVAFSLVPASLWPSMPKIVEDRYLGSAYAMIFWIQNIGLMLFPWLVGLSLDVSNPGVTDPLQYNYTVPMIMFACLGLSAVFLGLYLVKIDKKKGYGLQRPNKVKQ